MVCAQLLEGYVSFLGQVDGYSGPMVNRFLFRQLLIATSDVLSSAQFRDIETLVVVTICQHGIILAERPAVARDDLRVPGRFLPGLFGLIANPKDSRVSHDVL